MGKAIDKFVARLERPRAPEAQSDRALDSAEVYRELLGAVRENDRHIDSNLAEVLLARMARAYAPAELGDFLAYGLTHKRPHRVSVGADGELASFIHHRLKIRVPTWTTAQLEGVVATVETPDFPAGQTTLGLGSVAAAYAKTYTFETLPADLRPLLTRLREVIYRAPVYNNESVRRTILDHLDSVLIDPSSYAQLLTKLPVDRLGERIHSDLADLPGERIHAWMELVLVTYDASGAKPSAKWTKSMQSVVRTVGEGAFHEKALEWLAFARALEVTVTEHQHIIPGRDEPYVYHVNAYLSDESLNILKALIWAFPEESDPEFVDELRRWAIKGYTKVPGSGPLAARISNACLYKLSQLPGLDGVTQLSQLRLKIRHTSARKTIDKYLAAAAEREGLTVHEIEELSVDDFGMRRGTLTETFDDYTATLTIDKPGRSTLQWFRPDGKPQKSIPAAVKSGFAERLKTLRTAKKELDKATSAQRDRIDLLLRGNYRWKKAAFAKTYQRHAVLGWFGQDLIWEVYLPYAESPTAVITGDGTGGWQTVDGAGYEVPNDAQLALWHPASATSEEVMAWRAHLEGRRVQQPIRQAFREVYLLTPAELNTEVYSNRMAGHLLRQHQYVNLARLRGWRATLLGFWDSPDDGIATLELPDHATTASFYVQSAQADDAHNETGIWNYVATDQVRFLRDDHALNVAEVPPVVFSEVMRDCDLFVGVASVGNDPNWQDRGETPIVQQFGGYWREYAFGDLNELARSRRGILARLVPRLKIRDVATLEDHFLVVQGKLHRYKIHIGSGNILIAPRDQYLCIVPGTADVAGSVADKTFLPFEGDRTLSIILSKAFLLAEDDKITDPTITRQL